MYNGMRPQTFTAIMYTSAFCVRRLLLVCTLVILRNDQFCLIYAYNGIQTFYIWYVMLEMPHEENVYNRLEIFNELCTIAMQYFMVFFVSTGTIVPEH